MSKHFPPHVIERAAERERIRAAIEARIEAWIGLLDRLDAPTEDMEPSLGFDLPGHATDVESDHYMGCADDEPWLGAAERHPVHADYLTSGKAGRWSGRQVDQTLWAEGSRMSAEFGGNTVADPDLEDGHDAEVVNEDGDDLDRGERDDSDLEPDADREAEPWLGGYRESDALRFLQPDVREAARAARAQLNALPRRRFGNVTVLSGAGLPAGVLRLVSVTGC